MFVGHSLLAFALVALAARLAGADRRRALALAVVAGLFAAVPDVDMAYALSGLAAGGGLWGHVEGFWAASTAVHRSLTHSLVVAVPAAAAFAWWPSRRRLAAVVAAAFLALAYAVTGPLAAAVAALFLVAGGLVGTVAATRCSPRTTFGLALVGLVTHPFGDLFTGHPPAFFYPFERSLVGARVAPFYDPTANLLLAFGVKLAAVWAGALAAAHLFDRAPRDHVRPHAAVGALYALAVFVVPPPTMDVSYQFVFSVLAVGAVGVAPARLRTRWPPSRFTALFTGLLAVTLAWAAYAAARLHLGA